ncbi:type II toxin-antitoxin system HicB family antitoxin [Methanoplanus endosymbiosus]|uniref:Type II toxin-antitoxin system HicB family antitoxin n=1 Tax=Methanoplanus endosymbiosus TaxID=33865 RepID=A0A9E7PKN0_9EURY|nr:type II toxin-antitoxin system HicB family antitoxin [Methanoplanus endosymbiosus]UUX91895.1 type II toxin-antitoxin system HicB family antitoxin [Methanoplanus endosymbiosus]
MEQNFNFRTMLRKEPEGGYTAYVPSLPGCVTFGDTIEEATEMVREAVELYIESLIEHGEPIPSDDEIFEYNLQIKAQA